MPVRSPVRSTPLDFELIDSTELDDTIRAKAVDGPTTLGPPLETATRRGAVALVTIMAVLGPIVGLMVGRASSDAPATAPLDRVGAIAAQPRDPVSPSLADAFEADAALDGLELRLTSQDGRWEAWSEPLAEGATIYAPGGRDQTTLVVRDKHDGSTEGFSFARNLEPEAFSSDGRTLFTIDHRPARAPEIYRVTAVDLERGVIREVIGPDKTPLIEEMRGEGRQQVWAPDDGQLYTLYVRQLHVHPEVGGTASDDHAEGEPTDAFIHVLDVNHEWALCLELPAGFGLGPDGTTDVFVSDGGDTITVVDHAIGQRIEVVVRREGRTSSFEIGPPQKIGT